MDIGAGGQAVDHFRARLRLLPIRGEATAFRSVRPRAAQPASSFNSGWPDSSKLPSSIFVGGDSTAFSLNKEFPRQRYPGISLSAANEIGCGLAPAKFFQNGIPVDVEATRCAGWEQRWAPNAAPPRRR